MESCPFCGFDEAWVRNSPWDQIENRNKEHFVVQCNVCHGIGPESATREGAEDKWNGILANIDPIKDKEEFQKVLKESRNFERGKDPLISLDIGIIDRIRDKTNDSYSYDRYEFLEEGLWDEIIKYLWDLGYTKDQIIWTLNSKHARWAMDHANEGSNLKERKQILFDYFESDQNGLQRDILLHVNEEAMGGVSGPISTLNNTPGMGNAQPASTAATTAAQFNSTSSTGSGDKWDSSTGLATQKGSITESNISPYDRLGVAMAKKMGIPLAFKKGEGDKDVEQIRVDKDIDLSTKLMSFDEWSKKFNSDKK